MDEFPLFALSEEHRAIREAVRAVCDAKVAPYAAEVDEQARYPREAADALRAADFHAPHVPEEYGGAGADALATCLVIEEVARACVSSSLIPAVNKLGSLPVQIAGSEELKKHYLGKLAALLGHDREAEIHFEAALRLDGAAGMPVWLAHTQLDYGLARPDRGEELLRAALCTAERLGMATVAASARSALGEPVDAPARRFEAADGDSREPVPGSLHELRWA